MKKTLLIAAVLSLVGAPVLAAPCRDAKGRFTKCPTNAVAAPAPAARCMDAKGRFEKCAATAAKTAKTSTTTATR